MRSVPVMFSALALLLGLSERPLFVLGTDEGAQGATPAGGDGSAPSGDAGTSQGTGDEAATAAAAPADANAPTGDDGSAGVDDDWKFDLESVPEGLREEARKLHLQFKREFTQRTQSIAARQAELDAQAAEHQEAIDTWGALHDDSTQEQALNQLAERLGYEPTAAEVEELADSGTDADGEELDPKVQALVDRVQELEQERDGRQTEATQAAIRDHVLGGIDAYARDDLGIEPTDLDPAISKAIMLQSLALPVGDDGLPDIKGAIGAWVDAEQAAIEAYVASKDVTAPDVTGSSGVDQVDLSTAKARRDAADAVAARRMATP